MHHGLNPVSRCADPFMDQTENRPQVVQKRQKYWPRKNNEWLRVGVHLKPTAGQEQSRRYGANPSGTAHPIRRTLLGRRRYQPAVRLQKRVDSAGVAARRMWMVCSTCALPRRHKFKGKPRGKPRPRITKGFPMGRCFFVGNLDLETGIIVNIFFCTATSLVAVSALPNVRLFVWARYPS